MPLDIGSAIIIVVVQPQQHRTKVRRRRDLWVVSCSCDWSKEAVSQFSALMALRRHLEPQSVRQSG